MVSDHTDPISENGNGDSSRNVCPVWDNTECVGTPYCPPRCPRFFDRTNAPLLVQPLQESDWDDLIAMYESIESSTLGLPPATREQLEDWLEYLQNHAWNSVARDGEQLIGHAGFSSEEDHTPEFVVFVHNEYHSRGIGTELVKQVIAHAADEGNEGLELTVAPQNQQGISVYTNLGFEIVERDKEIQMRLLLDGSIAETVQLPPAKRPDIG